MLHEGAAWAGVGEGAQGGKGRGPSKRHLGPDPTSGGTPRMMERHFFTPRHLGRKLICTRLREPPVALHASQLISWILKRFAGVAPVSRYTP